MSAVIFSLLSIVTPEDGRTKADEFRNATFSTISFIVGASTSIVSGYLGMAIATYANARTAVEARKGIAPAFAVGEWRTERHCYRLSPAQVRQGAM
jgi:inorganic pyrophosphatase